MMLRNNTTQCMLSLEILLMLLELTVSTMPTQIVESLETTSLEMKFSQDK